MIVALDSDAACITIEAVDDEIAEGTEFFNLTVMANNTLDSVNGTTSIEIPANDGMHAVVTFDEIESQYRMNNPFTAITIQVCLLWYLSLWR